MDNEYTYELKEAKKTLTMSDMSDINQFYEAACTAEYILDNLEDYELPSDISSDTALQIGYEVRRRMDKYGYDEEEAIDEVIPAYRNS